jgi:hypothetical protein
LSTHNNADRGNKVLELYSQGKTTREIAKEQRLSLRDIGLILKKHGLSHGITDIDDNDKNNKKSSNENATQAYKLFSEGKRPVQVAIELNLREGQVNKFFREFWKLKRVDKLYEIYPEIEHYLPSFLKLHKALKKSGLNPNNVEWFAYAIETGAIKIPEIQKQYAKIKNELEAIDYKKTMTKYELHNINNQIAILNRDIHNKMNKIAYLHFGAQELEGYVQGLRNHSQEQPIS